METVIFRHKEKKTIPCSFLNLTNFSINDFTN
jgi:hypothetical protein